MNVLDDYIDCLFKGLPEISI